MINSEIVNLLRQMAEAVTPIQSAKIAAAVVLNGEPLAFGTNHLRSHPFQAKYGKNEQAIFWHAETNAIFNALQRVESSVLKKAEMYVVRVKRPSRRSKEFIFGTACPCDGCKKCLSTFKIRRVFYSTDKQTFDCIGF